MIEVPCKYCLIFLALLISAEVEFARYRLRTEKKYAISGRVSNMAYINNLLTLVYLLRPAFEQWWSSSGGSNLLKSVGVATNLHSQIQTHAISFQYNHVEKNMKCALVFCLKWRCLYSRYRSQYWSYQSSQLISPWLSKSQTWKGKPGDGHQRKLQYKALFKQIPQGQLT